MIDKWDFSGDYLDQFDRNYTGTIGDRFCRAIRDGAEDPKAVLDWITADLATNTNPIWQQVARTTSSHSSEAWDFAQHMLEREALPWEVKQELKRERVWHKSGYVKAKMAADAPSNAQLGYLESLGCDTIPGTKLEASELIDEYVKAKATKPKAATPSKSQPELDEGEIDLSKVPEESVPF